MINNKIKAIELKIDAVIIGRAIHPDLPLVGSLGTKLSKVDSKAVTASCPSLFIHSVLYCQHLGLYRFFTLIHVSYY